MSYGKASLRARLKRFVRFFSLQKNHAPFFFHGFYCFLWYLADFIPWQAGFELRAVIGKRRLKKLGRHSHIYPHNIFFDGRNTEIGDNFYSGIYNYFAGGPIRIGDNVNFANFITIETTGHCFDDLTVPISRQEVYRKPVVIEDDVWVGDRVTIVGGVTVGAGSVSGAGSVVTRDIPVNSVVAGNPARVIRTRGYDSHGNPIPGAGTAVGAQG